jgi:7-cyano-7-deazaguanine synthase in queuosine biosynthesis
MKSFIKNQYQTSNDDGKKHIILWSGGCDSSLLLYELLDAYGSENVIAISYKYSWLNSTKAEIEHNYREAFKNKMKLLGSNFANFTHHVFEINDVCDSTDVQLRPMHGLPQALGWLFMIPMYANENAYIYSGYIKDDDLTTSGFKEYYNDIFESVNKLIGRDNISLRLPYIGKSKIDIIEKLIYHGLYDVAWYCEIPSDDHNMCMKCHPCKTHMAALVYLSMFSEDELVKLTAIRKLEYMKSLQNENNKHDDTLEFA